MQLHKHALAIGLMLGTPTLTSADTVEERVARMEAMIAEMQQQLATQDVTIRKQATTITEQAEALEGTPERLRLLAEQIDERGDSGGESDAWHRRIEFAGVVEVDAVYNDPYQGPGESAFSLATFELGVLAPLTDSVEVGASLLYEQDDTPLEIDVAYVKLQNTDVTPLFLTAGQIYLPFGNYETQMVSDPLTLDIGETRETALQVGFVGGDIYGSVYAFNGDNEKDGKDRIRSWGTNVGLARETGDIAWTGGIGYLNDLGDSDTLQDVVADNQGDNDTNFVPAWTANASASWGRFTLIGEYLTATESFDSTAVPWKSGGAMPSAWNLEVGYGFEMFEKESTLAVGYQGTRESLALDLPSQRFLATLSTELNSNISLSFEWAYDKDYGTSDGGTGESANTFAAQLAAGF